MPGGVIQRFLIGLVIYFKKGLTFFYKSAFQYKYFFYFAFNVAAHRGL